MDSTQVSQPPTISRWMFLVGPLAALAAVIGLWMAIDAVGEVGPLDKAKLGGMIALPLTLAVPVLAAWAGERLGRFGRPALGALLGLAAAAAIGWPLWVEYAGQCAAAALPIPAGSIVAVALLAGTSLGGAVIAAGWAMDRVRPGRLAIGAGFAAAAVVFVIGFLVFALTWVTLFFGACIQRP
jgi:hypothetical protein